MGALGCYGSRMVARDSSPSWPAACAPAARSAEIGAERKQSPTLLGKVRHHILRRCCFRVGTFSSRSLRGSRVWSGRDLSRSGGGITLPDALARKYPQAAREWKWQWVFPATRTYREPSSGRRRRHHLHESVLQRAVSGAGREAGLTNG